MEKERELSKKAIRVRITSTALKLCYVNNNIIGGPK